MALKMRTGAVVLGFAMAEDIIILKLGELYGLTAYTFGAALALGFVAWYLIDNHKKKRR